MEFQPSKSPCGIHDFAPDRIDVAKCAASECTPRMPTTNYKAERIRDPLHNLIEFDTSEEFENVMWEVLQTGPFQRLRRIKQLGFSDVVYPGACHSRLLHSLGVFHTARRLMKIVRKHVGRFSDTKAQRALAAALVHDLGHGPFSHAFETVGKRLQLDMAKHETVSDKLIRSGEVSDKLNELGTGFASDVADIVAEQGDKNVYGAVVTSQFDADRLDYMQRDRLMTGAKSAAIDFEWLLANLQIADVPIGVDEKQTGSIETFVLGPKANMAAEAFVLGLFQLYPSVYFHKTTRVCEKHFVELLCKAIELVWAGDIGRTGLPENHPIVRFARDKDNLERTLELDDAVMWSAFAMMADSKDQTISDFASRLLNRRLYKCIDIRNQLKEKRSGKSKDELEGFEVSVKKAIAELEDWSRQNSGEGPPRILVDEGTRHPYKPISESKGPADRINILTPEGQLSDLRERSSVVRALESFKMSRAYISIDDSDAKAAVTSAVGAV